MLAHGSGIDDLAMVAAGVALYLAVSVFSRRRGDGAPPPAAVCPYCDARVGRGDRRCGRCGFRVPRRGASPG
jgi:predicted amidophosphoribosyltransferase